MWTATPILYSLLIPTKGFFSKSSTPIERSLKNHWFNHYMVARTRAKTCLSRLTKESLIIQMTSFDFVVNRFYWWSHGRGRKKGGKNPSWVYYTKDLNIFQVFGLIYIWIRNYPAQKGKQYTLTKFKLVTTNVLNGLIWKIYKVEHQVILKCTAGTEVKDCPIITNEFLFCKLSDLNVWHPFLILIPLQAYKDFRNFEGQLHKSAKNGARGWGWIAGMYNSFSFHNYFNVKNGWTHAMKETCTKENKLSTQRKRNYNNNHAWKKHHPRASEGDFFWSKHTKGHWWVSWRLE